MLRETHLKINLDNLEQNINAIKTYCPNTKIGAVLKANAYGHGAKYMAKALYDMNINNFLVATLIEAIELRLQNKNYNILIMGHTPDHLLKEIIRYNITPTIFTYEQAELINKLADCPLKIHLKIETGFNRIGMQINENIITDIKNIYALENIIIEGAFTHLTLKNNESDKKQYQLFKKLMKELSSIGIIIPVQHICDSISLVLYPELHLNMVRVGALLYGLESEEKGVLDIKPVLSFHTKISQIKQIKKGESISYGNRWITKEDTYIATLPFGYADGYPRNMYSKGHVIIKDKLYPIVGMICMDQCMIHLVEAIDINETVHIINEKITVSDIAKLAETNKNEIVSRFTSRVPRVYIKNNQVVHIENGLII